ncbi:acyl carrier protein [uncultured Erythrobacter sp.]|uniref:acyl carrier protein n=1 Tax=uncultured Erythrobacter sp. TaxID=263913 RepID=UPI0026094C9B|nr:acyl carrier protein [uncultured Erythrobacter sp.]
MREPAAILTAIIEIATVLRQESGMGGSPISDEAPMSELGFESLHLVEFMLSLSEVFGEEIVERLELDHRMSLQGLAQQVGDQLVRRKVGTKL